MYKKKSLGQHFLKDKSVIDWIVKKTPSDTQVIEIGPGEGALTQHLNPLNTLIFEMDERLCNLWTEKGFKAIQGDAVKTLGNNREAFTPQTFVVSNLPYNAGTQIYIELIKLKVPHMVLMFQKEVAVRIKADFGDKDFSRLSLMTKTFYEVVDKKLVKPGAFIPPPKVDSMVLEFKIKKAPLVTISVEDLEKASAKIFHSPRKKIKSAGINLEVISDKRAHELNGAEWIQVLKTFL